MDRHRDVTPLDFAINLDNLCMIVGREKQPKKRGYLALKLCRGGYFHTTGGLKVNNEDIVYQHRSLVFPKLVNQVSEFYANERDMTWRPIVFSENEPFTRWILEGGSMGFYSLSLGEKVVGGMFNNGREIRMDVLGKNYALFGEHSRGVVGVLVKMDRNLRRVLSE